VPNLQVGRPKSQPPRDRRETEPPVSSPKPVLLTRETIRSGSIRRLVAALDPSLRLLSEAEVRASLAAMLAAPEAPRAVWVFAYGSLMWNPAFHFVERRVGLVHGFHRRFCLWTHLGRGSPDAPGLMLALEPGGSCRGVVYRIAADAVQSELEIIWLREMLARSYVPRWMPVRTREGTVRAVAFTINRLDERYAGRLPEARVAATIAAASGNLGRCSEYLFNTVAHLEALGIHDRPLTRLRDRVARQCAETTAPRDSQESSKVPIGPQK
jgi:glutathione-specific gamma-glutamylcyclotransferase